MAIRRLSALGLGLGLALGVGEARAASLPPHAPLRILVIGDAVNPHGLSPAELTEPADLRAALADPEGGLNLDGGDAAVILVDSQCVDQALDLLNDGDLDAVVYFAHRAARACDQSDAQPALTGALEDHLIAGGGVVVFHHGIYQASGKEAVLQLLGGVASSVAWDANTGQRVIAVAPGHFVVDHGVTYDESVPYADPAHGVADGDYPSFVNLPDERYPALALLSAPGESRTVLFGSDYGGQPHVLGYDLQRPGWSGRVVFLQPGEHQPTILDPGGDPFQILANAVVHAAGALDEGGDTTTTTGDGTTSDASSGGTDGTDGTRGTTAGETGGTTSMTSGGTTATSGDASASASGGTTTSEDPSAGTSGDAGGSATASATASSASASGEQEAEDSTGCACRSGDPGGGLGLGTALALLGVVRRRRC